MRAVVGLGANLGDRLATMREAVRRLGAVARVEVTSRVYETAPVGGIAQGDFLNAAVRVAWDGTAEALLDELLRIERELGRVRAEKWGPRAIDLDVLWIDGEIVATARVVVPHPQLLERAFAVVPLLEVAPGAIDPRSGAAIVAPSTEGIRVTLLTLTA
jgi:2-amino-4-hydroxy-6-hydroxymethyldihydropteridine diphosphokinase